MGIYASAKNEDDICSPPKRPTTTPPTPCGFECPSFMVLSKYFWTCIRIFVSLQLGCFSSIERVRSTHTAFWQAIGIVPSSKRVEIIVLECLFVFGALHKFWYRILGQIVSKRV
jgi:hypothetical protein